MQNIKLIIQIPCLNEEKSLPQTLRNIPREIEGISTVEILVIDDGSTDRTSEVARDNGVDHIVRLKKTKGLAVAFMTGLDSSLRHGADIIVNIDADNQYRGSDIPRLIAPVLRGEADIVTGSRNIENREDFSFIKKRLQRMGSRVVRFLSGLDVPDATTGFRAYSKDAAIKLNVVSEFTYTLETLIAAGNKGLKVDSIPVKTNPETRKSRLFKSIPEYILRSMATLVRVYTMYQPLKVFAVLGSVIFLGGFLIGTRFLYFYVAGQGTGHIQSLILAAILLIMGFQILLWGLVSDLIAANRRLNEDILTRIKSSQIDAGQG